MSARIARRVPLAALTLCSIALSAHADEVLFLKDGQRFVVKRLERSGGRVFFETVQGQRFFVPEQDVVAPPLDRIPLADAIVISLRDGRRLRVRNAVREGGRVLFEMPNGQVYTVPEADVADPPLASIPPRAVSPSRPPASRPAPGQTPPPAPTPAPAAPAVVEPVPAAPAPPPPPPMAPPPPYATRFEPFPDRWEVPLPDSPRIVKPKTLDPYRTSSLKGDVPVIGDAVFVAVSGGLELPLEARGSSVGVGVASPSRTSADFLGEGSRLYSGSRASLSFELFHGPAAFRPKDWAVKATGAFGLSYLNVSSVPAGVESSRTTTHFALQEAHAEARLLTLSPQFDFVSLRAGIQPFVSDFRGLVFNDANPGARLYGTAAGNGVQWNLGYFDMLRKQPETRLLTFDRLERQVAVASVFVLDVFPSYRLGAGVHRTRDESAALPLTAWHAGIVGEGPAGRFGLSHALHVAWGRDEGQPLEGRATDVQAFLGAAEVFLDRDWQRYRASFFYASGDRDPRDGKAEGFDAVQDQPVFAGSADGFWARSGIALPGAGVLLKAQDSLLPSLRTGKFGRPSFVNPGLVLAGVGTDLRVTPKLRARAGASYLRFADPSALEALLRVPQVRSDIGFDLSLALRYRPRLDEHLALSLGIAGLVPGDGWRDLDPAICAQPGCAGSGRLWSVFMRAELSY